MAQADNPGEGSLGVIQGGVDTLTGLSETANTVQSGVVSAASLISADTWTGDAATAWKAEALNSAQRVTEIRTAFEAAIPAIQAYHDEVDRIKTAAQFHIDDRDAAQQSLNNMESPPAYSTPEEATEYAQDVQSYGTRISDAEEALRGLHDQREAADQAVIGALQAALPVTWQSQHQALVAAGIDGVDDLVFGGPAVMIELANRFASGNHSQQDVNALAALYALYGEDPEVMDALYTNLGGGGTVRFLDELSTYMNPHTMVLGETSQAERDAIALAQAFRNGLAVGSQDWDEEYAQQFADDLFNGESEYFEGIEYANPPHGYTARIEAIAFLFGDANEALMGEHLTVSAAHHIDTLEREGGIQMEVFHPTADGARSSLFSFDAEHGEIEPGRDAAGRVFESLGHYPEQAYDFLTDSAEGAERIEYWYGERDWTHDGFAGPANLWVGAQVASLDDATPPIWGTEESAALDASIINELAGNESFLPENVSGNGAAALATSFLHNMAYFAEQPMLDGNWPEGSDSANLFRLMDGSEGWGPAVNGEQLEKFMAAFAGNDDAAALLGAGFNSYRENIIDLAISNGEDGAMRDALDRVMNMQGYIDGAIIDGNLGTAGRQDAADQAALDALKTVVGAIPIPGLGGLVGGTGGVLIDMGQSIAVGQAQDFGWGLLSPDRAQVMQQMLIEDNPNAQQFGEFVAADTVYQYLTENGTLSGVEAPPTLNLDDYSSDAAREAAMEDYRNDAATWLQDNRDEIETAMQEAMGSSNVDLAQMGNVYMGIRRDYV